jgi:hypothetical protein
MRRFRCGREREPTGACREMTRALIEVEFSRA